MWKTCIILLIVFLLVGAGRNTFAQQTDNHKNYENAVKYLTQDGLLTENKIKSMTDEKGHKAVLQYAREHGWSGSPDEESSNEVDTYPDAITSTDIDALCLAPSKEEIKAVWKSFDKKFKIDRFEFIGNEIDLGENVIGWNFSHYSQGLKIYGYLYKLKGDGPFPLIIANHGGFGIGPMASPDIATSNRKGDPRPFSTWCYALAKEGYVVMASSYRGTKTEAGLSEGIKEGGRGEVADVLNMLACAKTLSFVNKKRIGMFGTSHGGWITAFAVQRTKDITAGISFFPPVNMFFPEDESFRNTRTRVENLIIGKSPTGAIGTIDKAVFLPLLQGKATIAETRTEMIARTIHIFAEHTNSPLYIMCGDKDFLYPQSVMLYETLNKYNKETWFKNFPGERHGFTYRGSPEAIESSFHETVVFFDRHLK